MGNAGRKAESLVLLGKSTAGAGGFARNFQGAGSNDGALLVPDGAPEWQLLQCWAAVPLADCALQSTLLLLSVCRMVRQVCDRRTCQVCAGSGRSSVSTDPVAHCWRLALSSSGPRRFLLAPSHQGQSGLCLRGHMQVRHGELQP